MPIPARSRLPRRLELGADARLEFLERLHSCSVEAECAEQVLVWLADARVIRRGLCATLDSEQSAFEILARHDFPEGEALGVFSDRIFREKLLALAYDGDRVRPVAARSRAGSRASLQAAPLGRPGEGIGGLGVLVVEAPLARPSAGILLWAARLLGDRLHSVRDDRGRAERDRLRREKEWLDRILNAVSDPVLFTDADGRILVANSAAEALLTSDEQGSEGRRRAVALNNMLFSASLARTGADASPRELPLVDPGEGVDLLFELISAPASVRGEESGIVSVLRDITDLRRASEQIEENLRLLRAAEAEGRNERDRLLLLLGSVAEPVLVTDSGGDIEMMNPPAERLFTVQPGSGTEAAARVGANDAVFTIFLGNLMASPAARWRGRLHLTDPISGAQVPMEAISAEVRSREGTPTAIITILHDLTEAMEKEALYEQVKRHSEELRERVREATTELAGQNELLRRQALELEQASNLKSQFLASMSHELRTPLNAIIGYTHLLAEGIVGELTSGQRDRLRRLDANAKHLLGLINDLLDIARIEAGKMPVNLERFDLPSLIGEVVEELEPLIQGSKLRFTVELEPGLTAVRSDRQKVKQILVNLVSNALKFTERGSVCIAAGGLPDRRSFAVAVSDTGIGISEESQRLIFEAFAQADRPGGVRGTGLGLAICRRLAGMLDGEIRLESEPGRGSIFTLVLPQRRGAR